MMKTGLSLLVCLSWISIAGADPAPVAPNCATAASEDAALFGGKSARQFFSERLANTECQSRYEQARKAYDDARAELKALVDAHASADDIDAQDQVLTNLRTPYLSALTECGPCAANAIQPPVVVPTASKTQYWYKSDASCQLPATDKAGLDRAFDQLTGVLTHTKQYPTQPNGDGFDQILGLSVIDNTTGNVIADTDQIPPTPTYLYISIFGPTIGVPTAFSYYFQNTYQIVQNAGARSFTLSFDTAKTPRGFQSPSSLPFHTRGGKSKVAYNQQLNDVTGIWYVNSDGYLRYCTAADFKVRTGFIETIGRDILLNTISQAAEKATASASSARDAQ